MARPGDFRGESARKNPQKYANMGKSSIRAGKSKGSTSARKLQNAGVKDGTIKVGKNGKSYNVYDAKTGTWKRGVVKAAASTPKSSGGVTRPRFKDEKITAKPKVEGDFERWFKQTYPGVPYPGVAAAKAKAKKDGKGPRWWQAGGGGLVGSNKK